MQSGSTQLRVGRQRVMQALETVCDPEVPVLTILDLGIVRSIENVEDIWQIDITPTYSGCPAMNMIEANIRLTLDARGIKNYRINTVLEPAWTTDWMSEAGRKKLKEYGIAPPQASPHQFKLFGDQQLLECPRCESTNTECISQFGSTSCKALYRCLDCKEPFDYFKCH